MANERPIPYARITTGTLLDHPVVRQTLLGAARTGDERPALSLAGQLEHALPAHAEMIRLHHSDATSFPGASGGFKMDYRDMHTDMPDLRHSSALSVEPRGMRRVLLRVPGDDRSTAWITYGATLPAEQAQHLHEALVAEGARRASV